MRFGPVPVQVLLDGLHDVVDEIAQERLLVALGVLRHSVVERQFFVLKAKPARSLVAGVHLLLHPEHLGDYGRWRR